MIDIVTGLPLNLDTARQRKNFERDYSAVFGDDGPERGRNDRRATDAIKPPVRQRRTDSRRERGRRSPPPATRSPQKRGSRRRSRSKPDRTSRRRSRSRVERRRSRSRADRAHGHSRDRRSRTRQRMTRPNYSSNRSDLSLSRELRKDLMNKHAFGTFSVADFDATARTFWDNGYQSVTSIRDMDAIWLCARTRANISQRAVFSGADFH